MKLRDRLLRPLFGAASRCLPLRDEILLMYGSSKMGRGPYWGNPRALFEYGLQLGSPVKWVNDVDVSVSGRKLPTVSLRGTTNLLRALNPRMTVGAQGTVLPYAFIGEQTWVIQTWHGTPFKRLVPPHHMPASRRYDVVVSPGREFTRRFANSIHSDYDTFVELGNPRNDILVRSVCDPNLRTMLRRRVVPMIEDPERKLVCYMPTFRRRLPFSFLLPNLRFNWLNDFLTSHNATLLFKGHPLAETIGLVNSAFINLPPECDPQELLAIADVLITDYSSAAYDFLVTNKPICYGVHDIAEYEHYEGLLVEPMEEFAGSVFRSEDELEASLSGAFVGAVEFETARRMLNERHNPFEDGRSTERVWSLLQCLLNYNRMKLSCSERVRLIQETSLALRCRR